MLAATEYIVPSIELIDSRITDWKIGLADTIADNASSAGGVILGAGRVEPANVDIGGICAVLFQGEEETRGARRRRCSAIPRRPWPGWPGRSQPSECDSRPGT